MSGSNNPGGLEEAIRSSAEPSRQWRNRYWFCKRLDLAESFSHARGAYGPGLFVPDAVWPSREIAEQLALECIAKNLGGKYVVYLGPEPVS
jgi:hypothetical protein